MDNNRNWYEIGNEIRDAVEKSIRTGDFSGFGNVLSDTVNEVVDEAKRQVKQTVNNSANRTNYTYTSKTNAYRTNGQNFAGTNRTPAYRQGQTPQMPQPPHHFPPPRAIFKRKGDVSSVLFTVFGGIGTGITAVGLVVFGLISIFLLKPLTGIIGSLCIALGLTGSIGLIAKGAADRKRLARAERYLALSKNHNYVNISELAVQTGKNEKYVRRDVKKMLSIGMFPQGHLDKQENCLMLSDDTYREYLRIERERSAYELSEFAKAQTGQGSNLKRTEEKNKTTEDVDSAEKNVWRRLSGIEDPSEELRKENPALAEMICFGQECTGHIRQMNAQIPGEVITQKLNTLENVLKQIFTRVREHPNQMPKMKKFMDYYLPTTRKLVEAYKEFDSVANPNTEITEAKAELEKTLDTINQSFEELLQQLYQESVFDATTDAKVLQTMLAKDGLAKDHTFSINE